jgi:hypothetical protein
VILKLCAGAQNCRDEIENVPKTFNLSMVLFKFLLFKDSLSINQAPVYYRGINSSNNIHFKAEPIALASATTFYYCDKKLDF